MYDYYLYKQRLGGVGTSSQAKSLARKLSSFKSYLKKGYNVEEFSIGKSSFSAMCYTPDVNPKIAEKEFACLNDYNCSIGSVLVRTVDESHWLATEENDSEKAYFRGVLKKALFNLTWRDPDSGVYYSTWAAEKGPEETSISSQEKDSHNFDIENNSLYLIISKHTLGYTHLKRYFTILVNGKKWEIQVVDSETSADLLYAQAVKVSIDRELDDVENGVVDGLKEFSYALQTSLDGVAEVTYETTIDLSHKLLLNDVQYNLEPTIKSIGCLYDDDAKTLSFPVLGAAKVEFTFDSIDKEYIFTFDVVSLISEDSEVFRLAGDEKIGTFLQYTYTFEHILNGVAQDLTGAWTFDEEYFTIVSQNSETLSVKVKGNVGQTSISYLLDGETYPLDIRIVPILSKS